MKAVVRQITTLKGQLAFVDVPDSNGPLPPPGPGTVTGTYIPFIFSTSSPIVLAQLLPDDVLSSIAIEIVTPFDDPAATILLGTNTNPSKFMTASDSSPQIIGQYQAGGPYWIGIADFLILTLSPFTSTTGSAFLYYELCQT